MAWEFHYCIRICHIILSYHVTSYFTTSYAQLSKDDPAESGLESKRILNAEVVFFNRTVVFLVQRFHNLDSKDLGLNGLNMNNDRKPRMRIAPKTQRSENTRPE